MVAGNIGPMGIAALPALSLLFLLAGPEAGTLQAGVPRVLDRIAAVVGDDLLLESDVDRYVALGLVERRTGENDGTYRERILNERVVELLRERELRKTAGFSPDQRDVEARFRALSERVTKERGVPFADVLAAAGVTRDEALDWTRRGLAIETFVKERLLPAVKVTDEEMAAFYAGPFQVEAKAGGVSEVPPLREVEDQVRVLLRERKLNAEVERWTDELRQKTRVVVYRRPPDRP
jgi:hypothetical protein